MKGIILAGGAGTRLSPLTLVTSKQLLPVYNRPMIYYPLSSLIKAGVKDILIIIAPERERDYRALLGNGEAFGVSLSYKIQNSPRGLADAFILGEEFLKDSDHVVMVLGDNIFEQDLTEYINTFSSGARIFAKEVSDPERFGVVTFDERMKVTSIEEKPQNPKSSYAIPGIYIYDSRVVAFAKELVPSKRNELEIVDLHNRYLALGELDVRIIEGEWLDAGTFDSLVYANKIAQERLHKQLVI